MKKTLLIIGVLACATMPFSNAQGNSKKIQKKGKPDKEIAIISSNDTLAYAYGANLAEQGLREFLEKMEKIESNPEKMEMLLQGLNDRVNADSTKSAYYTGILVGTQVESMVKAFAKDLAKDDLNIDLVTKGISDALKKETLKIAGAEDIIQKAINDGNVRKEEEKKLQFSEQIEKGKEFLEENKAKTGVVTTPSGLQYKILVQGKGQIPTVSDKIKVNYKGNLLDGTEFDNSYKRGEPITFGVDQVIPGWTEVLQLMPVGSKWEVYVPADLAYGNNPVGNIPPYSTLIFEIELLNIEDQNTK